MKGLSIVLLLLLIFSCEKNIEPIGGQVYLETDKDIYTTYDSICTYLVNNSNMAVFSHPPREWSLHKKIDDEWILNYPTEVIAVVLPPREWNSGRMLVFKHAFQDTGIFRIQMPLSWDKEYKEIDNLGCVYSNEFNINIGT